MRTLMDIEYRLSRPLEKGDIRFRDGPGRKQLEYLSGSDVAIALNYAAGPLGWDRAVDAVELIEVQKVDDLGRPSDAGMKYTAMARAKVTVSLRAYVDQAAGAFERANHQDIGHGTSEKQPSRAQAIEFAEKAAVTDAIKRACRFFGPQTGLLLMFKEEERDGVQALVEAGIAEVHKQHPKDYKAAEPAPTLTPSGPGPRPALKQALEQTAQPAAASAAASTAPAAAPAAAPPAAAASQAQGLAADFSSTPDQRIPAPAAPVPQASAQSQQWSEQAKELERQFDESYGWKPPAVLATFVPPDLVQRIVADPSDTAASAVIIDRADANAFHQRLLATYFDKATMALWAAAGVQLRAGVQITKAQIVRLASLLDEAARATDVDVAGWLARRAGNGTIQIPPQPGPAAPAAPPPEVRSGPPNGAAPPDLAEVVEIVGQDQKEIVDCLSGASDSDPVPESIGRAVHALAVERILRAGDPPTKVFDMWPKVGWISATPERPTPTAKQVRDFVKLIPRRSA